VKAPELRILYEKIKQTPLPHTDKFMMHLLKTIAKNLSQQLSGSRLAEDCSKASSRRQNLLYGSSDPKRRP
jgi:hypothetical protein